VACSTPDTYRAIIKHCQKQNILYHTYQLKEDRAFRVVNKNLHYTTNLEDIITELLTLGHKVRNIINVKHRQTKEPLNIFFMDLEPASNNKDIYEVTAIQNKIIHIEPPRSTKPHILQCVRYQQYGHTRKHCNKSFNCVKCGGPYNSATCTKPRDSPAKCAMCGGPYPANYNGCEQYHNILNGHNAHRLVPTNRSIPPSQENSPPHVHTIHRQLNTTDNKGDAAMRKWSITILRLLTLKPPVSKFPRRIQGIIHTTHTTKWNDSNHVNSDSQQPSLNLYNFCE
jgi:hypothetical protein